MAGHSRRTLQARRLAETGDAVEHPEYERAGRDLRLGEEAEQEEHLLVS